MSPEDDIELKKLRWRCRRGMRELDQLFGRYLDQRWGQAPTAERAVFLQLLETEDDIDLVLLDMQLPDMNGDQIARFMQQEPHLAQIPIVVLSANVRKAEQQLEGINIAGALAKPINTNIIVMIQKRTTTCVSRQPFCSK